MGAPRVLLVDDEDALRRILARALENAGYEVLTACDGRRARMLSGNERVDLVVTDLLMPECDGLEFLSELRKSGSGTPIIAVSGGGVTRMDGLLRSARHMGADRILRKPFSINELLDAAAELTADHPGQLPNVAS